MARLYGPGPADPPRLIPTADLAGLSTSDVEDRPVGELFGALAEEDTGLIRYLDVSMAGADRHVLVPIGHARVDRESVPPRVRLRAATYEDLMSVPPFQPDDTPVDREYEDRLLEIHGRLFYGSRYYAHPSYDHRGLYVGEHPVAGPEEAVAEEPRLHPLTGLTGFRVARHEKDIRGWPLVDRKDRETGEVRELLVDVQARQVRYVVVALDEPRRETALPVGYLEIDAAARIVSAPALTRDDIRLLPAYDPPLTRAAENRIQAALEGRLMGDRYYQRPDFRPG
ncbi:MAG TPA: PRC-barrel domain-containing protein [Longimicrobiales bacterium]|nr:PRC-barrel domain-containing protein [Longimicrobiales bacterium]